MTYTSNQKDYIEKLKHVRKSILNVLDELKMVLSVQELTDLINTTDKTIDNWDVREAIWDLSADGNIEITRDWRVKLITKNDCRSIN
jgi:hypothetical protein